MRPWWAKTTWMEPTRRRSELVGKTNYTLFCFSLSVVIPLSCLCCSLHCRCRPVHTKIPWCSPTDRVLLLTEKASVICAKTRAGGQRGNVFHPLATSYSCRQFWSDHHFPLYKPRVLCGSTYKIWNHGALSLTCCLNNFVILSQLWGSLENCIFSHLFTTSRNNTQFYPVTL